MANREQNFVSAVIYVHNAEKRISQFLTMVIRVMEENFEHSEIICVNDCSEDDSLEIIRRTGRAAVSTSVSVVNMSYFHGLELAMNAGVDLAIGDYIFEFDHTFADFAPGMIMETYRHALSGYDIVSASPDRERITSKLFYKVFAYFTERNFKMTTERFRVLSRRVVNRINSMNKVVPYRKVLYAGCGLKTDNIRYQTAGQIHGERMDKKEKGYRMGLAMDSLILFTEMGYSFSKAMTAVMMIVSLFMIVYSVVIFVTANPVAGWTTTILFLSIAFLGLFGILTVIMKYLQLLVDLVFKRKHYSFETIEKLTV